MGSEPLRRDALRVLLRLDLIVRPSDSGRECGDNAARHFEVPSGAVAERLREPGSLTVPTLGSVVVEEGSGREEGRETGGVGGAVHAYIVTDPDAECNTLQRNFLYSRYRARGVQVRGTTIRPGRDQSHNIRQLCCRIVVKPPDPT